MKKINRSKFKYTGMLAGIALGLIYAHGAFAGSATLTWNANNEPDLAGYKIYYGTASHAGNCPAGFGGSMVSVGKVTTHTLNNLTNGQTYYFQITAVDTSNNESGCSSEVSKTIAATDSIAPVTTASPTGGTFTTAQSVTLTANESATIYYTTNGTTPTTASTQYTGPISITSTKTLKYFARDTAGNNESVKSQTYTITLPDTTAPVTTASPVGGTFTTAQSVALTANETATIYYTTNGATPTTASSQYAGPILMTAMTTLKYFAKDAANNSEAVKTQVYNINIAVVDATNPSIPGNVTAATVSPSQIALTWNASTDNNGVAGYKIYRHSVIVATVTGTSYSDAGLVPSTVYRYRVAAFDASGNVSAQSNEVTAVTQAAPIASSGGGGGGGSIIVVTPSTPSTTTQTPTTTQSATPIATNTGVMTPTQPSTPSTGSTQGQYTQFGSYVTRKHLVYRAIGEDVKRLQNFLRMDGYLKDAPTGYYGKATLAAVQAFQREHGIAAPGAEGYGEVGLRTRAVLNQHLTQAVTTPTSEAAFQETLRQQIAILQAKVLELLKQLEELKKQGL